MEDSIEVSEISTDSLWYY